ncbi:unnamed protein product, partial [marine sediment metagenome]
EVIRFIVNAEQTLDYDQVNTDLVISGGINYFDDVFNVVGGLLSDEDTIVEATFTRATGLSIDDYGFVLKLDRDPTGGETFISEFSNFKTNQTGQFITTTVGYEPEKIQVDAFTIKCRAKIDKTALLLGGGWRVSSRLVPIIQAPNDSKTLENGDFKTTSDDNFKTLD